MLVKIRNGDYIDLRGCDLRVDESCESSYPVVMYSRRDNSEYVVDMLDTPQSARELMDRITTALAANAKVFRPDED